ncbi:hypothetical protein SH2C18_21680 [Clostridium sediminicola]|uniref:hypothetical protein n=1 Tax=Clostridium sediminicola TaxID=3114879 RepID=UPI0031F23FB9
MVQKTVFNLNKRIRNIIILEVFIIITIGVVVSIIGAATWSKISITLDTLKNRILEYNIQRQRANENKLNANSR